MSGYMVGLADLLMNGQTIGYIEKDSFNMNPVKQELLKLMAEQKPTGPVKVLPTSNASIAPTFNLFNLTFETFYSVMGGTLVTDESNPATVIGWNAPSDELVLIEGDFVIKFRTGQELPIGNAVLTAALGGQVNLTSATRIECELTPVQTEDSPLYGVYAAGKVPASISTEGTKVAPIDSGDTPSPVAAIESSASPGGEGQPVAEPQAKSTKK